MDTCHGCPHNKDCLIGRSEPTDYGHGSQTFPLHVILLPDRSESTTYCDGSQYPPNNHSPSWLLLYMSFELGIHTNMGFFSQIQVWFINHHMIILIKHHVIISQSPWVDIINTSDSIIITILQCISMQAS